MQSSRADRPILTIGAFDLYDLRQEHVDLLARNLSKENLRELEVLYEVDPVDALNSLIGLEMSHAVLHGGKVVGVCGVDGGQFWAVFSKRIKKVYRSLVRVSPRFISFYHEFFDELHSDVWVENVFIHNWLVRVGFMPECAVKIGNGEEIVRFVRCKSWYNDIVSGTSRPVMH